MGLDADRGWSRIRRVPGSIPGATGSGFVSYFLEFRRIWGMFGTHVRTFVGHFRRCLGHVFGICSDIFGHVVGRVSDIFGHVWDMFSDMFGTFLWTCSGIKKYHRDIGK